MKYLILILLISACGDIENTRKSEGPTAQKFDRVYDANEDELGYLGGYDNNYMIIEADGMTFTVDPATGEYKIFPLMADETIYFEGADCTGDSAITRFNGEVSESMIKAKNGNWYNVYAVQDSPFEAQSKLVHNSNDCINETESIAQSVGLLAEIGYYEGPYNAPLVVVYE
ncbi:MAG: hypothetical protein R3213_06785 [Flavobacteriaceae bacterium]|nr:hypothetical protein [Flavobacteriaceae bacterium]